MDKIKENITSQFWKETLHKVLKSGKADRISVRSQQEYFEED